MKQIAAAIAAFITFGFAGSATAGQPNLGDSILLSELISDFGQNQAKRPRHPLGVRHKVSAPAAPSVMVSAPVLDASQPPVPVAPPILAGSVKDVSSGNKPDAVQKPPLHTQPAQEQSSMLDKMKEMDRKKNAWFRRTFLRK